MAAARDAGVEIVVLTDDELKKALAERAVFLTGGHLLPCVPGGKLALPAPCGEGNA